MSSNRIDFRTIVGGAADMADDNKIDVMDVAMPALLAVNKANGTLKILERNGIDTGSVISALIPRLVGLLKNIVQNAIRNRDNKPAPPDPNQPGLVRIITGFLIEPFWYEPYGGAGAVSREKFLEVLAGAEGDQGEPMIERSRLCANATPLDQNNKKIDLHGGASDPEVLRLFWYPADEPGERDGAPKANTPRMRWYLEDGDQIAEITGGDHSNGMTPKIKVPAGSLPEKGTNYRTGHLYGEFETVEGEMIETPRLPSYRMKK